MSEEAYLIVFYKGDISALTLFCQWPDGNVCYPKLPKLSSIVDADEQQPSLHALVPTALINQVNNALDLDDTLLEIDHGFYQQIELADGFKTVYLARLKCLDPPHALLNQSGCYLKPLMGLIGGSPVEMALLQAAYVWLMEG